MSDLPTRDVTRLLLRLREAGDGDAEVRAALYSALYGELHRIAGAMFAGERDGHTLQPTAVVHEAFLRLIDSDRIAFRDRSHFLGVAARAMRQVLVDHARSRGAAKRGGGTRGLSLSDALDKSETDLNQVLDLDRALSKLSRFDERMAQVVELRVFAGLTREEVGRVLEISGRSVAGDWAVARRWLARELSGSDEEVTG